MRTLQVKKIKVGSGLVCFETFSNLQLPNSNLLACLCEGDLEITNCGRDLLLQRKQALFEHFLYIIILK